MLSMSGKDGNGFTPLLETRSLVKRFGSFTATDRLDIRIGQGEIHAILGENGAGKSTLMNMLSGLLVPDEGEIVYRGKPVRFGSPRQAMECGIGMVHQHFMLVPALTVAENVMLGLKEGRGPWYKHKQACTNIRRISASFGLDVDPTAKVGKLSVGQQQRVEIVKTLYRGADFIILDEPTAVLTPPEAEDLFRILRSLREQGKTIVFISHKLNEVEALCDRVTVLRSGKLVVSTLMKDMNTAELARLMVGREVAPPPFRPRPAEGGAVLEVRGLAMRQHGVSLLQGISLDVCEGEIVGIAGVDGNGQRELCEAIMGLADGSSVEGVIRICGQSVPRPNPRLLTGLGVAYIPEDRQREGLALPMSIGENMVAKQYDSRAYSRFRMLRRNRIREAAAEAVAAFKIKTPSPEAAAGKLSGGNQQKVILARELMQRPNLLLAMQPTRGMDIGAAEYVHRRLLEERKRGCAILLISAELDEVLALSDRIAVMYKGRIVETVHRDEADLERIGLRMAGL
ncbi:ABC transporter ATP-binding protein [Paenibacillus thailandensis]|uniref:ABC transporter ATP-binding protein n=1 Tax=Paenibacillus thailandensis TaxID=393250 RepID=A0ABW5QUY8_9BACL